MKLLKTYLDHFLKNVLDKIYIIFKAVRTMTIRSTSQFKKFKCNNIIGHGPHTKGRMHTEGIRKGKET
jgi:hypothetical protein